MVIPGLISFEKSGTFINRGFFAWRFNKPFGPAGVLPELNLLVRLLSGLTEGCELIASVASIWESMTSQRESVLKGISFDDLKENSILLDGSRWDDLLSWKRPLFITSSNPVKAWANGISQPTGSLADRSN